MQPLLSIIVSFDFWLKLFLCLVISSWFPGITQNNWQFFIFDYGSLLLFGLSTFRKSEREFRNYNVFLILICSVLVTILNNFKAFPVDLIHVIAGCLLYFSIVRSLKDFKGTIKVLFWIAIINSIVAGFQILGFDPLYAPDPENQFMQKEHLTITGLMGRSYHLSYFLSTVSALSFFLNPIWWSVILIIISFGILLFTKSYVLIFSLSCLLLFFIKKRFLFIGVFGILILILILGYLNISRLQNKLHIRLPTYAYIIKESIVNPFKGYGLGSFDVISKDNLIGLGNEEPIKIISSYNQYLRIGYELGWTLTIAIFTGVFFYFKKLGINKVCILICIPLLLFPMFHEILRFARLDVLIIISFALLEIFLLTKKEENHEHIYSV